MIPDLGQGLLAPHLAAASGLQCCGHRSLDEMTHHWCQSQNSWNRSKQVTPDGPFGYPVQDHFKN